MKLLLLFLSLPLLGMDPGATSHGSFNNGPVNGTMRCTMLTPNNVVCDLYFQALHGYKISQIKLDFAFELKEEDEE